MNHLIFTLLFVYIFALQGADGFSHNTYQGKPITPETLLKLAPKMTEDCKKKTDQWMEEHKEFVSELVTTPHPLTRTLVTQKSASNAALIGKLEQEGKVQSLSKFNYVLKFLNCDFTVPVNRWGSRVAYWAYASDQGSVLDPSFKRDFDCAKFEHIPSYQHCSRVAHYLRLIEIMETKKFKHLKTTPTYLKHIPGKPTILSDENYVVVQTWVENLKEIKQLPEEEQGAIWRQMKPEALKEIYDAVVYAALWDISSNLAITGNDDTYYMVDLEEPFNHKPQFFYFQGEDGLKKYVLDVKDGIDRVGERLRNDPQQLARWIAFVKQDGSLQKLFAQYNVSFKLDSEHLQKKN